GRRSDGPARRTVYPILFSGERRKRASIMRMTRVVAIAAVLTASLGAPAVSQSQPPVVSAPRVPQIGDSATIKLSNETVTRAYIGREGDLNCFSEKSSAGDSKLCSTPEGNLVRRTGIRPALFTPHSGLLSFP